MKIRHGIEELTEEKINKKEERAILRNAIMFFGVKAEAIKVRGRR